MSRVPQSTTLAIGDSVWLKCGGPELTVVFDDGEGTVHVSWFDTSDRCGEAVFPRGAVESFAEQKRRIESGGMRASDERPAPRFGGNSFRYGRTADGLPIDDDIPF